ncbi:TlpA family protein disulfide reductase [Pedobacter sp. KLB.chiD]|uniref:TlpA family protein disulfide reductase n=1 Tax=Pedobacter sp. KLB.chiD TaxID=3387402 RepID=UPI0039998D98
MYLKLSESFVAMDINDKAITKEKFLKEMMTAKYVPVRMRSDNPTYKLYPIKSVGDPMIPRLIGSLGKLNYTYFKMEGQKIPSLRLTDINGHSYNPSDTKGRIIVMKFWYISCVMCVKEMPVLNDLVDSYKHSKNVEFISLAFNDAPKLREFLKEHRFLYPVIPNMESYAEKLKIPSFPTHLIVRDGKILKAVGSAQELITEMKKQIKS